MAYQPKSYRKFLAGAVTTAVVASSFAGVAGAASFTDVNDNYKEAVNYLVSKGIKGTSETEFGTYNNIKRVDAAVFVVKALGLDVDKAPASGFTDVPERAVKEVNALKEAGITSGKTATSFGAQDLITRGELAIWLDRAFELEGKGDISAFTDANGIYTEAIEALVANKITNGTTTTTFGTKDNAKRGDFAIFVKRAADTKEKPEPGAGTVKAINDTKLEVTFDKAVDADLAVEIEKDGDRFVIYDGGQTANSAGVIKSQTISFNADRTKASIILDSNTGTLKTDISYKVALMDGSTHTVATVVKEFGPTVLKKGAAQPEITVDAEQDKFILEFNEKMNDTALNAGEFDIYENNTKVADLEAVIVDADAVANGEQGKWVDSTVKTAVEFKLDKAAQTKLLAGKTYRVQVSANVETDKGDALSESERIITVKTPNISEAQPEAKVARVVKVANADDTIVVTFDKDLDLGNLTFNKNQVIVKKPSGQTVAVDSVVRGDSDKEIKVVVDGELDTDLTYTVELPANGVANAYFPNASNKAVTNLKAQAQQDIEVTSVEAKFIRQVDNKGAADLLLTFNQRVDVANLKTATGTKIVIKDGDKVYEINDLSSMELYHGDSTGKTVIVKNVTNAFDRTANNATTGFTPETGVTYKVELAAGVVKTDAGAKTNQEKLKTTVTGLGIAAPTLDKVRLESAEKIVVEFEEDIDAANLEASDIKVQGYEQYSNGNFATTTLSGSSQLKFSASGNTLTITPANDKVKFETSDVTDLVVIEADSIKGKDSGVENSKLDIDTLAAADVIDRATPVIIGATYRDADEVVITYSEPVAFKADGDNTTAKEASQFTVENASKNAYGTVAALDNTSRELTITFNEAQTFKSDLDLAKVKVVYTKNTNVFVKDVKGNEASSQTITGLKR